MKRQPSVQMAARDAGRLNPIHFGNLTGPCPVGTIENSPTLQRWDGGKMRRSVPEGRLKIAACQSSLRDEDGFLNRPPNVETLGLGWWRRVVIVKGRYIYRSIDESVTLLFNETSKKISAWAGGLAIGIRNAAPLSEHPWLDQRGLCPGSGTGGREPWLSMDAQGQGQNGERGPLPRAV